MKVTRDMLIAEDANSAEIIKPFLVGEDIRRYTVNFQERYLIWTYIGVPIDKYPAIYKYLQQYQPQLKKRCDKGKYWWELRHCDYYVEFEKPKIIYPVIAINSKFVLDEEKFYSNDKTFFISAKNLYLLALLKSHLLSLFFTSELSNLHGGFMEFRAQTLVRTFIYNINFITSPTDRQYYKQKAARLYQQCLQELGKPDCVLGFVDHYLAQGASDVVHDLLESLAETMLDLNQQKQDDQKAFLAQLVASLRVKPGEHASVSIETLTGKGRLLNYIGDYKKNESPLSPDDLWAIVKQNRSHTYANPGDEQLKNRVLARYQQSLDTLLLITEQLRFTDNLIDQVVYRLYGLSKEEITVVEGTGSSSL